MTFLVRFVRTAVEESDASNDDGEDERAEATRVASEVLFAMNQLAINTNELSILLDAIRRAPVFSALAAGTQDAVWTLLTDVARPRDERLAVSFARFVSNALSQRTSPNGSGHDRVLHELVGDDVEEWKQSKWEREPHVFASPTFSHRAFGRPSECEAMVTAILRGFSIPQVDADSFHSLDLAAFLLAVDLDTAFGLRHGVDVSFVRDGELHPKYGAAADVLAVEDIMDAFTNKFTVGIRGVHARFHRIAAVCSALQRELLQHVNANIYCAYTRVPSVECERSDAIGCVCVVTYVPHALERRDAARGARVRVAH